MSDPFARLGLMMAKRRVLVLAFYFVLVVVLFALFGTRAKNVVKGGGFVSPNSNSDKAASILLRDFRAAPVNSIVVIYHSPNLVASDPTFRHDVVSSAGKMAAVHHVTSVVDFYNTGDPSLISHDRHYVMAIVSVAGNEDQVTKTVPDLRARLVNLTVEHFTAGIPAIQEDTLNSSEDDLRRSEVFTLPIVLLLLIIVFQTIPAAVIPVLLGASAVSIATTVLWILASFVDTSVFALNVGSMIGLGLGIDFSLIVVSRYRQELEAGRDPEAALAITMSTAGRSITYSGITVILSMGLFTILMLPLMIVRSISLGVMIVAFTALLSALTLLPALLSVLGHRIEWLRVIPRRKPKPEDQGFWYKFSHLIMARPVIWLLLSLLILIVIALPIKDITVAGASSGVLPSTTESVKGTQAMSKAFGPGRVTPIQVVVQTQKGTIWNRQSLTGLEQLTKQIAADYRSEQVESIFTVAQAAGISRSRFTSLEPAMFTANTKIDGAASRFVNLHGGNNEAVVTVISRFGEYDSRHEAFVTDLRDKIVPSISRLAHDTVYVGGAAAGFIDFRNSLYGRFPFVVAAVMALIFIILMMFFQSVALPFKAILMNLATIVATYGALTIVFVKGFGSSLLGFTSQGAISAVTPAILYTILFALSTDYEVFMLSRVKEYHQEGLNNEEAVARGLQNTAGLITAAGIILIGTFGSFATANVVTLKEIGLGLAIGVALDTTVVRIIMVPSTMRLMGDWNWWMPVWLKKLVPEIREGAAPAPKLAPALAVAMPMSGAAISGVGGGRSVESTQVIDTRQAPTATISLSTTFLRPTGGSIGVHNVPLRPDKPLRIGRDSRNELQLFDPFVSRFHARIEYHDGAYTITDQGSSNGVFVNLEPIPSHQPFRLNPGDTIRIAGKEELDFVFEQLH